MVKTLPLVQYFPQVRTEKQNHVERLAGTILLCPTIGHASFFAGEHGRFYSCSSNGSPSGSKKNVIFLPV